MTDPDRLRFGIFEIDLRSAELRKAGTKVKLQQNPFQVLRVLLLRPGELVTREELHHELWGQDTFVDFDNNLNTAVNKIREALGDSATSPRFVETITGHGYRFIAPVQAGTDSQPVVAATKHMHRRPIGSRISIIVIVALTVASTLAVRLWTKSTPRPALAGPVRSLAVLPMRNLSGDPSEDYLAGAVTDELITNLARIGTVRVISSTSSSLYSRQEKPLPQIARELGADVVVEGSITHVGDHIRIRTQLIDGRADRHLWAEIYDCPLAETFALQTDIARQIAEQIGVPDMPHHAAQQLAPEAVEAYLRGRYYMWRDSAKAAPQFLQAIAREPKWAAAYAGLAITYASSPLSGLMPSTDAYLKGQAAAEKAIELDPNLPEAHLALGISKMSFEWDWQTSRREFERALALDQNSVLARVHYAYWLMYQGHHEQAIEQARLAQSLDPLGAYRTVVVGDMFFGSRRFKESLAEYERALELDPKLPAAHERLATVYEELGRYDDLIAEYRNVARIDGFTPESTRVLETAYRRGGYPAWVRAQLDPAFADPSKAEYVSDVTRAEVYAQLGNKEKAFALLGRSLASHDDYLFWLNLRRDFDSLRSDPRFPDLLRRIGLPQTAPQLQSAEQNLQTKR